MTRQTIECSSRLITPDDLPHWVPGDVLSDSSRLNWKDLIQRTYKYHGQDVEIPPLDSFLIVQYCNGQTPMDREYEGRWTRTQCSPGHFSLLSRAVQSHWHWTQDVVVSHLYLTESLLNRVARDLQGQEIQQVQLHDVLQGQDPIVSHLVNQATIEAKSGGIGGNLYSEALAVQLSVHLLRNYASCVLKANTRCLGLSQSDLKRLEDYVEGHLAETITIEGMAGLFGLGAWTFNRMLQRSIGMSAYAYVIDKRLQRALSSLRILELPIKAIAYDCGFSDQAHLTRAFSRRYGVTPGRYRASL